jgi:hypothetical protein
MCIDRCQEQSMIAHLTLYDNSTRPYMPHPPTFRNPPNPIGIVRTFRPALCHVVMLHVTLYDVAVLEELRITLDSEPCSRLLILGLVFKSDAGSFGRSRQVASMPFPSTASSLASLRVQRVRIDWNVSRGFGNLWTLVLRDLGRTYCVKWGDFRCLFAGAQRLQKLAIRNVSCCDIPGDTEILPLLSSLTEFDLAFGSNSSLEPVLARMAVPVGISVHFFAGSDDDVTAFGQCPLLLGQIGSFTYTGIADDVEELQELFLAMTSVTHLTLLAAEEELLESILLADAVLTAELQTPSHACPLLRYVALYDLEPAAFCNFFALRGSAIDNIRDVRFGRFPDWDRNFELDLEWFKGRDIRVRTGVDYIPPSWICRD